MIAQTIADYGILGILGRKPSSGRVTYLAQKGDRQVVIKQFQFAKGADWSSFKELEREISILKSLQHPQIPRYIESFESETGFCLVQEYISAPSLAELRSRSLEQVKDIGRQLLEILAYLQALHPPVLHRDIKPENVLCNEQGEVFLVDFGFSRLGSAEVAASSIMVGTTGFIPPELFAGREPTKASDLYSLGATLLSLITGTPSTQMDRLLGEDFRFSDTAFEGVDRAYANWLRKMTAVRVRDRFADAKSALDALEALIKAEKYSRSTIEEAHTPQAYRFAQKPLNVEPKVAYGETQLDYESFFGEIDRGELSRSLSPATIERRKRQEKRLLLAQNQRQRNEILYGLINRLVLIQKRISSTNISLILLGIAWFGFIGYGLLNSAIDEQNLINGKGKFIETTGIVTSKDSNRGNYKVSVKSNSDNAFTFYVGIEQYSALAVGEKACFRSREKPSTNQLNFSSVSCKNEFLGR